MIKASLDLHDPVDIYDQLRSQFGNLSMLIKDNTAILTFQNVMAKRAILQNPKRLIKGFPLTLKSYQEEQEEKKAGRKLDTLGQVFSSSMDLEDSSLELENTPLMELLQFINIKDHFKTMKAVIDAKINEIKERYTDSEICNKKINEFNNIVKGKIKLNTNFKKPFENLTTKIKNISIDPAAESMDLETTFFAPVIKPQQTYERKRVNNLLAPGFQQIITNYSSVDIGSVKRLCMLNEENFITTLKLNEKGQEKGQLRIYRKQKQISQFNLDIEEGPYSLMMHENFILAGGYHGHIHMIDINNDNLCEFSNRLSYGLIVHMQKYETKTINPSILTLTTGERNDYKIKQFEIERQKITSDIDSLFFHPREEILCQGITMTLEVLNDGKFAYGCGRNTYICPSFNKNQREYYTHDQYVMKIRMKNPQQLIEATQRKILSLDLRACKPKNNIFEFKHDINNLQLLSEHHIFYGGKAGQVGVIDCRKPNIHIWNPPEIMHRGKISDILKMGDDIISADSTGNIFGWKRKNLM